MKQPATINGRVEKRGKGSEVEFGNVSEEEGKVVKVDGVSNRSFAGNPGGRHFSSVGQRAV